MGRMGWRESISTGPACAVSKQIPPAICLDGSMQNCASNTAGAGLW